MARKTTPTPQPTGPNVLTQSKSDFKAAMERQVVAGKEIKARQIKSESELRDAEDAFTIWDNFNRTLLGSAFTDERKRKEYDQSGPSSFRITRNWQGEYENFASRLSGKITGMESILSQVPLFQESQGMAAPEASSQPGAVGSSAPTGRKVFLVHGHNHDRRNEVKNVIHDIKLQPVILDGEANQGMTVIDRIRHLYW
jgi:hypothetical protein